ncbi:3-isopropylmalate dehydratase [Campylobacter sp. faydin G-24]|uniref:3-isopropylmalate dehydratase n=1 Tax=Campylobacter anatolicus TaxID=2829105 RepID=A0ABS5HJI1_9BACT|nr:3-isopropylmalate dehydratase [Campylobacter anatolicus]MBR8462100.1 3-isopropylmalate dehydratase [Campylobacter anatolicus]MBR8463782.1 3-isopropylmalate dehydratase [Campylobacter anatolicus]MBR8464814.1 3-isopropylmalate dehydratase [Campylobacter anatolicus]
MQKYDIAFAHLDQIMPFLNISSAGMFIGMQAGLIIVCRYFMRDKFDDEFKYITTLNLIKRFSIFLVIFLITIATTSILTDESDKLIKIANPMANAILTTKWTLETLLAINMTYIYFQYKKALNALRNREFIELDEILVVITYYLVPFNIIVSLTAVYLGISYKDF